MRVKEGGSWGIIYGNAFRRNEDGSIMVDETSKRPLGNTGNKDLLGNANPDFTMGWSNTLTYKNLELYFLIDFRFGGEVMSLTQSELDANGVDQSHRRGPNPGICRIPRTEVQRPESILQCSRRQKCHLRILYVRRNLHQTP